MYVKREVRQDICILTFNRPEIHNALNDEAQDDLLEAFTWAQKSKDFKIVLLRGEGRSFCSGRDTRLMGERKPGVKHYDFMKEATRSIRTLLDMGKPLIAAVKGAAIGAGAEMAMVADFRISATDLKFALPEAKYGLSVDQGGSALAASLIGPARTKYLLMTGNMIDAKTAYDWGLVDFLVSPEELDAKAFEMAASIANQPSYRAVMAAKELVDELWSDAMRAAMRRELLSQVALLGSEEFVEMREKRRQALAAKKTGG
ncbi:MAG: enoyl-CoA hydratase/isomerase family protein [Rhodospirillaceae bacterium]|nr:MAG: enoyl-CoA hydratase/isomerase family protein [Rhodospirillaceae bacterium]